MTFVHQALVWGFLLALLPLLIHLINLMRHRRVKWAAMEFLLKSHKKHRKWVWLKQLMLLLMRMAAIALLVGMLAQWISHGRWMDLVGGKTTHHYVLLDDSASMADQAAGTTAFNTGIRTLQRMAAQASQQDMRQKITLIRFSQALGGTTDEAPAASVDEAADFNAETINPDFPARFEEVHGGFEVTELPVGPRPALALLQQLVEDNDEDNKIVYVLSDFRKREWASPTEIRETLHAIQQADAEINLVDCVSSERPNLAVTAVTPSTETRAAGVPLFVDISVTNYGQDAATNVPLKIQTWFHDPAAPESETPQEYGGESAELPAELIDSIGPGETVTRQVQVLFNEPGRHVVEAKLDPDALPYDNRRWSVVDFPDGEQVLIVDGDLDDRGAFYLSTAFQPGARANTGIRVQVEGPAFLRDRNPELLRPYSVIYLLNVGKLDNRAVNNLESYVANGGGLGVFTGPDVDFDFYNSQLYKEGKGLFPLPLESVQLLPPDDLDDAPDFDVEDHPIFSVFLGERNTFMRRVTIERYHRSPITWKPAEKSSTRVIARLRNGAPLCVEQRYGDGRVVAVLTAVNPDWNDWVSNPSFVVAVLKMQSFLASSRRTNDDRLVGAPIDLMMDRDKFSKVVTFVLPDDTRTLIERTATSVSGAPLLTTSIGRATKDRLRSGETDRSGVYECWIRTAEGDVEVRRWAVNVEPIEGDLAIVDSQDLVQELSPVKPKFMYAEQYQFDQVVQAGLNRSLLLMILLIGLLLGEQFVAMSASYHPPQGAGR